MADEKNRIVAQPLTGEASEISNEIRALMFQLMDIHEREAHGGAACGYNRAGFVAWLAHCLGIGTAHQQKLWALIANYESGCPCGVPTLTEESFNLHRD